jgi:hypothetical protein
MWHLNYAITESSSLSVTILNILVPCAWKMSPPQTTFRPGCIKTMKREELLQYFKTQKKKTLFYRRRGRIQFVQAERNVRTNQLHLLRQNRMRPRHGRWLTKSSPYLLRSSSAGPTPPYSLPSSLLSNSLDSLTGGLSNMFNGIFRR